MGSKNAGNDDTGCSATVKKKTNPHTFDIFQREATNSSEKKRMPGRQTEVLRNDLYQHRLGAPEMGGGLVGFFLGHRVGRMMVAVIMEDQGVPFTADSILHEIPAFQGMPWQNPKGMVKERHPVTAEPKMASKLEGPGRKLSKRKNPMELFSQTLRLVKS